MATDTVPQTDQRQTQLVPAPPPQRLIVQDELPTFDTAKFDHMFRIAKTLANSSLTPKHLRGNNLEETQCNCMRVVNQAVRWQMDPFAVIDTTYVVHGKLGYEGKLVAAVINSRSGIKGGLKPIYNSAKGDNFGVVVYASNSPIPDEAFGLLQRYADTEDRSALNDLQRMGVNAVRLTVGQAKTDNGIWQKDPEQKLFYSAATKWARRHCPELMLGVLTDDDLDRIREDRYQPAAGNLPHEGSRSSQLAETLKARQKPTETPPDASEPPDNPESAETPPEAAESESVDQEPESTSPPAEQYVDLADAIDVADVSELNRLGKRVDAAFVEKSITAKEHQELHGKILTKRKATK